ncbi:MAG: putative toxin-antitoxin system toxin component, PIN family [Duodenibacillus sp.]
MSTRTVGTGPFGLVPFLSSAMPFDVTLLATYPTLSSLCASACPMQELSLTEAPFVVLDTNVVLDVWYWKDAGAQPLAKALQGHLLKPVVSCACLAELADVVSRAKFGLSINEQSALLENYGAMAHIVTDPPVCRHTVRDPDDQKFLDLAVAVGARWLLTKDKLLSKAARREKGGLKALEPARLANFLENVHPTAQPCT